MLKLKSFKQTPKKTSCGPVSLQIVLDFYGIEKTEDELIELCKTKAGEGTDLVNILEAAENFGFKTFVKDDATLDDVLDYIKKGVPVIVDWFTRGLTSWDDSDVSVGHYSVVAGIDEEYIYIQDPQMGGIRKLKKDAFVSVWFDFEGDDFRSLEGLVLRRMIVIYR